MEEMDNDVELALSACGIGLVDVSHLSKEKNSAAAEGGVDTGAVGEPSINGEKFGDGRFEVDKTSEASGEGDSSSQDDATGAPQDETDTDEEEIMPCGVLFIIFALFYVVGKCVLFAYQMYDLVGVYLDVATDVFFFTEFRRAYPTKQGLQALLIATMVLPSLILVFLIMKRVFGFRPSAPKKISAASGHDVTDESITSTSCLASTSSAADEKDVNWSKFAYESFQYFGKNCRLCFRRGLFVVLFFFFWAFIFFVVACAMVMTVLIKGFMFAVFCLFADVIALFGQDVWHNLTGVPGPELVSLRGIIYGVVEDLPQLAVQVWVLFNRDKQGGMSFAEISPGALMFASLTTAGNILNQMYKLWKRARLMKEHGLSMRQYFGHAFGVLKADVNFAPAYASLIREGKYNHHVFALQCAGIGDDECIVLLDAIEHSHKDNRGITKLSLSHNCIGDRSMEHLAQLIQKKIPLETIDLEGNQISDEGVKSLAHAIPEGSYIEVLDLRENPDITKDGYDTLIRAFAQCEGEATTKATFSDCPETSHLKGANNTKHVHIQLENRTLSPLDVLSEVLDDLLNGAYRNFKEGHI